MAKLSEAKKRAIKKWNDENMKERYDRIQLVVYKGKKEEIQTFAASKGESLNGFVNRLIDEAMNSGETSEPIVEPTPKRNKLSAEEVEEINELFYKSRNQERVSTFED